MMLKEFAFSLKTTFRALAMVLLIAVVWGGGNGRAEETKPAEEPMPTEEVVQKLTEMVKKLTPFSIRYDSTLKMLAFTEELESEDKAEGKVGELQVHLDRMEPSRIGYEPYGGPATMMIKGERLGGQVVFHCREGQRCVRRGFRDAATPALVGEETDETTFRIDILDRGIVMGDLRWFAALVQHLATISGVTIQLQRTP
jgi:hypothetical protein